VKTLVLLWETHNGGGLSYIFRLWLIKIWNIVVQKDFCDVGKGDCDKDIDDDFAKWQANMWVQVHDVFELSSTIERWATFQTCYMQICRSNVDVEKLKNLRSEFVKMNNAFRTKIRTNKELQSSSSGRSTRHIEFELPEGYTYTAGDHLAVYPHSMALKSSSQPLEYYVWTQNPQLF